MSTPAPKSKTKTIRTTTKESDRSKDRDKDKDGPGDTSKEEKLDRLKTVVRRLPPNLPEEVFWQSVQTWVTEESVTWKMFYPGKLGKR
jgi:regulator of nonsense transcripts 3